MRPPQLCVRVRAVRPSPAGSALVHRSFLRKIVNLSSPSKPSTHTRALRRVTPPRYTASTNVKPYLSASACTSGSPQPRSADASPRAVPPKDHALLLLPPSSVPPSLSASLAPRWPHGATDRAQTSSFSNLFFFVSPPLFLSASLRPSSLFLPLFSPTRLKRELTRPALCVLLSQNSLFPAAAPSSRPSVSALRARLSRACAATARARPQCNLLRLRRRGRLGGRR